MSASNIQHPTSGIEHPTPNIEHRTTNNQQLTMKLIADPVNTLFTHE
jgi:hypothetical protein